MALSNVYRVVCSLAGQPPHDMQTHFVTAAVGTGDKALATLIEAQIGMPNSRHLVVHQVIVERANIIS